MIKVLYKTFDVLEYVAARRGQAVLPQEVVKDLELPQPTCVRIMKDLADLGYLQQLGARKGYVLGPVAYFLADGRHYRQELYQIADPEVDNCARMLGQSVLLATRHGGWRQILCHHNYNPNMMIYCSQPRYNDLYFTASGRLLLAYAPETELVNIVDETGLPTAEQWPEAAVSMDALKAELQRIRNDRFVKWSPGMTQSFNVVAFALPLADGTMAAVGASWPMENSSISESCIKEVGLLTKKIAARLNQNVIGG